MSSLGYVLDDQCGIVWPCFCVTIEVNPARGWRELLHGFSRTSCRLQATMIIWPAGKQWAQVCLDSACVSNPLVNCCYRIRCGKTSAELFGLAVL